MIQPLGKRIIVKRDPVVTEIAGFIVPEGAQQKELSGTVVAVGKDVTEVTLGDRVCFGKFDGQDIDAKYAEDNCIIINEEQIKGVYV